MIVRSRSLLLTLAALLVLVSACPDCPDASGSRHRDGMVPLGGWLDQPPFEFPEAIFPWEDVAFQLSDRLVAQTRAGLFPQKDVAVNLTNRLLMRTPGEEGAVQLRELGWLQLHQGIVLGGQEEQAFGRLVPEMRLSALRLEVRAWPASTLHLRTTAAYEYAGGRFELLNAGLTLRPLRRWTTTFDLHFHDPAQLESLTAGMRLTLSTPWSVAYTLDYRAQSTMVASHAMTALYRFPSGNIGLQMVRSLQETRIGLQVNLATSLRRTLGF